MVLTCGERLRRHRMPGVCNLTRNRLGNLRRSGMDQSLVGATPAQPMDGGSQVGMAGMAMQEDGVLSPIRSHWVLTRVGGVSPSAIGANGGHRRQLSRRESWDRRPPIRPMVKITSGCSPRSSYMRSVQAQRSANVFGSSLRCVVTGRSTRSLGPLTVLYAALDGGENTADPGRRKDFAYPDLKFYDNEFTTRVTAS